MNVRLIGLAVVISCWYCATSSVSAASNGVRPRRQSPGATLNEYLTPPAPPNAHALRDTGLPRNLGNHHRHGASQLPPGPAPFSSFRHGKTLTSLAPASSHSQGYFARLMGWFNPFGGGSPAERPPPPSSHHRPDNTRPGTNVNSGYLQPPPGPNGHDSPTSSYGSPPAPSHGSPTNNYESYAPGQSLPRPPSPQGARDYHRPQQAKNCNPCNQVPWVPLYNGVNTDNSRYASGSVDAKPTPSLSYEIKTPDFGYAFPAASPVLRSNIQLNNQNLNYPQREYGGSAFTGPIPNPHLYPGAMPPLFKAKPFDSQPQATGTAFDPRPISQSNRQSSSSSGGGSSNSENLPSGSGDSSFFAPTEERYRPPTDLGYRLPAAQDQRQCDQRQAQNGVTPYDRSIDRQRNEPSRSEGALDQTGYVDTLPPGAEIASGPDDHLPPPLHDEHRPNDNGASNSDFAQTVRTAISEQSGPKDFQADTSPENGNRAASHVTRLSTDGQHIIHYEQSPVIDLSSEGTDEKRKESNDSSASPSTSTDALEDPLVVLQNPDGTYGIDGGIWSGDRDSSNISSPNDINIDGIEVNLAEIAASSSPDEFSSESDQFAIFEDAQVSPDGLDIAEGPSSGGDREYEPSFTGYLDELPKNNSGTPGFPKSGNESLINQRNDDTWQSVDAQGSVDEGAPGSLGNLETQRQRDRQFGPYPDSISHEDGGVKSYDKFNKDAEKHEDQGDRGPGSGRTWFDPQRFHSGAGFQTSRVNSMNSSEVNTGPTSRRQASKNNKQVRIIIPYTSQYTPKPFHPSPEDRSAKTTSGGTQARKAVPVYDKNREYLAQETRRIEAQVSQIVRSLENSSRAKDVTRYPVGAKANTSIDVLRLQKNIDNWTIQEYSRGTTVSVAPPKSSRPYLSPSKQIPDEYLTTTEPVVPATADSIEDTRRDIGNVLARFSFNDLEHEASSSDKIHVSHVEVSSHLNETPSVLAVEEAKSTTATSIAASTTERDSWKKLPVSISPLNKERVYVVTPQVVPTVPTNRNKSEDKSVGNDNTRNSKRENDSIQFETMERAYQVLPQAVNNLAIASTGSAVVPLWGIMEHEDYASTLDKSSTSVTNPILYAGHSKVSHTRQ